MKSAIRDIFYNNHVSFENIKASEEYRKINERYLKLRESFESTLTDEQKKLLNDICDALYECEGEQGLTLFIEGFKLGLKVGVETFN